MGERGFIGPQPAGDVGENPLIGVMIAQCEGMVLMLVSQSGFLPGGAAYSSPTTSSPT